MKKDLEILKSDPMVAEKKFNGLTLSEQSDMFLRANDQDRLRLVEMSHQSRAMLEKVPATEIWLTIKRLSPEDTLTLIKYATPEQLQVVCDIEWWRKDRMDSSSVFEWLEYISACGTDKVVEWFQEGDWDQIQWFFKETIIVFKREDKEVEPADAVVWPREEAPISYEGLYYIQVLNEDWDQPIRRYLEILAKSDNDLYLKICEACIWDIPSTREEEAFEVRSRRLAEHGFPSFDEAISVYAPLSKKRFGSVKKRTEPRESKPIPHYPLVAMGDEILFINRVLKKVPTDVSDGFLSEVASIANKILIADGFDINIEDLTTSLKKTVGYVNIGLELLSEGDLDKAASLMEEYWLVPIFQVGLSEAVCLSNDVRRLFNNSWIAGNYDNLALLEPNDKAFVEALLEKRPKNIIGETDLIGENRRDFYSNSEIVKARAKISGALFVGEVIERLFIAVKQLMETVDYSDELRFSGVLATAIANKKLGESYTFKPIRPEDLKNVDLESGVDAARDYIIENIDKLTKEDRVSLDRFIDQVGLRIREEFAEIKGAPAPEVVRLIWMTV